MQNDLHVVRIENESTLESVSIVPQFGANVNGLALLKDQHLFSLLDGNYNRKDFFEDRNIFKGAKLVPFANRLKDGYYIFAEQSYQLDLNYEDEHHACHGFIFDKPFTVVDSHKNSHYAEVRLRYDYDGGISGYPFPFRIELNYQLWNNNGFACKTLICNRGKHDLPMVDGWHPFLKLGSSINHLKLTMPVKDRIVVDDRLIPTGEKIPAPKFKEGIILGKTFLDTCFTMEPGAKGSQNIALQDPQQHITLNLWQETGSQKYNFIHVYTPPHRNSIAIEPMSGNINAFNNEEGLVILKAEQTFEASYGIYLS